MKQGYFLYCRKSTEAEDRQVLSIDSQIAELKQLAERQNLSIVEVLTEARSAKAPGRPVFNEMMNRLYRGEAQGVICWKLDRLARNPIDGAAVIWAIRQNHIAVVTPSNTYRQEDENTILMYIEFGMAQKYIDDLSKNVKRGLKAKAERGWFPGTPPVGYLNTRTIHGDHIIVKDPERFPLVRRMWDLMLTGCYAPPRILEIASNDWGFRTRQTRKGGDKPLARSAIYRTFTNPFYAGMFEFRGQLCQGRHEPMVTLEEFDQVQLLLGRKGRPRSQRHTFAFTGLIRCGECGAMITAEEKVKRQQNGNVHHYVYYHCTKRLHGTRCRQPSIERRTLEQEIDAALRNIQISEAFKEWALRYVREAHEQEVAAREHEMSSQRRAYDACVHRLEHLLRLKISPENTDGSLLSDEEYREHKIQLVTEKARLEDKLRDTEHHVEHWVDMAEQMFVFACHAREWFAHGTIEDKRQILMAIGSNLVLKDKKLGIEATKPFFALAAGLKSLQQENRVFEPLENGAAKPQRSSFAVPNPVWQGLVDDVRTSCQEYGSKELLRKLVERLYSTVSALVSASKAA
jgi:DNA invertase Pin-like site-specific DNA recombinase